MTFEFVVYGIPAPQGSKRHVGNGRMIESSAKVKPWREAVKAAVFEKRLPALNDPMDGPLDMTVVFTLPKPAGAPKRTRTYPSKRPDLDKLLRSTFDALSEACIWRDDAQVVSVRAVKVYPNEAPNALNIPGARIWVTSVAV